MTRDVSSRGLLAAGLVALFGALFLLGTRFLGFELALSVAARRLSPDGIVSATARDAFAGMLVTSALAVAAAAGTLFVLSAMPQWRRSLAATLAWDGLKERGLAVPSAHAMLVSSSVFALAMTVLWQVRGRLDEAHALFAKEGPFEHLTFLLEILASAFCAAAALRWRSADRSSGPVIPTLFGLCALVLLLIAMEEINWGQTIFGFRTPEAWAAINTQQETSLHNLLDREALNAATRVVSLAFGSGFLLLLLIGIGSPRSTIAAIAPPTSLAILAACAVYGGLRVHPEHAELLLAALFALYGYRLQVATTRQARMPAALATAPPETYLPVLEPDVPLRGAELAGNQPRRWDTELLEYTHDAIIIWEMGQRGIRYWNRAAEQLYGYTREEAFGRTTHELLRTELAGGVKRLESTVARFGIWVGELRHTRRDGHNVDVQGRLALMSQRSGRWLVLEVNRDITDRKAAEVARRSLETHIAELTRLRRRRLNAGPRVAVPSRSGEGSPS